MSLFIKKVLFPCVLFIATFFLILNVVKDYRYNKTADKYIIKSYKNTVALYKNDILLKTYENIVLNTLPQKDILSFNNGISVSSPLEAETVLEDYDG